MLNKAVLAGTITEAQEDGYQNFSLTKAGDDSYVGSILPPLKGGWTWTLDLADSVATVYELDDRAFTVTFPFPKALIRPSDFVVVAWGFQDASRTPTIYDEIDVLGYARIRCPKAVEGIVCGPL